MKEFIEIPFGAKDSELGGWEYNIPEGYTASIESGKIIVKKEENENEKIRKEILALIEWSKSYAASGITTDEAKEMIAWLEKQGDIDRRIQEEIEKQTKQQWKTERQGEQKPTDKVEQNMELTDFESALFTAFSDAWQQYLDGEEVNVAQWAKEHSTELLEVANQNHVTCEKEPKKVHVIDEGKAEMDYCFTKMMNGEKVSPTWSEEDEENLNQLHKLIVKKAYEEYEIDTEDETLWGKYAILDNWLKLLKGRVQPNQWKPSEEQLNALNALNLNGDISYVGQQKQLIELYEQLEKL